MNKSILATAALAASAATALASDLPSLKAPPPVYVPPSVIWTGFYVGLNAGYAFSNNNNNLVTSAPLLPGAGIFTWALSANAGLPAQNNGFIGGGQAGYNWQFARNFLVGVETDIQGVAASGGSKTALTAVPFAATVFFTAYDARRNLDYLGTVRGRVGFLFTPTLLIYGTGGLAYGGIRNDLRLFQFSTTTPFGVGASSYGDTRVGWTAGGGLEWMFWPNWSAKVEYLYYDLGRVTNAFALIRVPPGIGLYAATQSADRFNGNIVRAGVNYHFNWGATPILASY
ncbi:outer membrane beta-barrel protein [Methylocystis sp.]|uniref:outer membrane protein n=1 Tax=Methylocystis sp. TaxID=1911079 RepID=UPI0025E98D8A|nr:outer membrane beta-barrel protein [Methylocystis sp.]